MLNTHTHTDAAADALAAEAKSDQQAADAFARDSGTNPCDMDFDVAVLPEAYTFTRSEALALSAR